MRACVHPWGVDHLEGLLLELVHVAKRPQPVEHLRDDHLVGCHPVDPHPRVLEQVGGRQARLGVPREHALDAVLGGVADLVPGVRLEV